MKSFKCLSAAAALMALGTLAIVALPSERSEAATQNFSIAIPGVQLVPIQLAGQYTVTEAAVVRFALPYPARLTSPTLTVDARANVATVLTAPVSVTAGSVAEGSIGTATLADESVIPIDLAITGTSPTWDDITVVLTFVRT